MRLLRISAALLLVLTGCRDKDRNLERVVVPPRVERAEAREGGRVLFVAHCVLCHGERADGQGLRREGLDQPPRDFTSAAWRSSVSPGRVFVAIRDGVPGSAMPGWRTLTDDELWDLTAYVLSVAQAP